MELTIEKVVNSIEALREITNKDVPIKVGIALARNTKEVNEILEVFNKKKETVFDKYSEGEKTITDEADIKGYNDEIGVLVSELIEINTTMIDIEALGDINIRPSSLLALDWMIEI